MLALLARAMLTIYNCCPAKAETANAGPWDLWCYVAKWLPCPWPFRIANKSLAHQWSRFFYALVWCASQKLSVVQQFTAFTSTFAALESKPNQGYDVHSPLPGLERLRCD